VDALGTEPSAASRALYLGLLDEDRAVSTPDAGVHEVRTLLNLLRDALDGLPDIDLSRNDPHATTHAQRLVGAA